MDGKPLFGNTLDVFHARLAARDDWDHVAELIATASDPVEAVMQRLDVTDLGAQAVVAMAQRPLSSREEIQSQLKVIEQIRDDLSG